MPKSHHQRDDGTAYTSQSNSFVGETQVTNADGSSAGVTHANATKAEMDDASERAEAKQAFKDQSK